MNEIEQAKRDIATAAAEAVKVIANAAEEARKIIQIKGNNDHDLLIELRTEMRGIKDDIKRLSDGTATKITVLENTKADMNDFCDLRNVVEKHATRIGKLENKISNFWIFNFVKIVFNLCSTPSKLL